MGESAPSEEGSLNVKPGSPRVLACIDQSTTLDAATLVKLMDHFRLREKPYYLYNICDAIILTMQKIVEKYLEWYSLQPH